VRFINLSGLRLNSNYSRATLSLGLAQAVILLFLVTNSFTNFTTGNINILIFLSVFFYNHYSKKHISALIFLLTFFISTLILTQATSLLGFDAYSQTIFILCLVFSFWISSRVNFETNTPGKLFLAVHATFFLFVPYSAFRSQGVTSNLATFISGWDHTGGHFYIIKTIRESGAYKYFPADYIGANPKLFHAFMSFFVSKPISALNDFAVILFFEFFLTYIISFIFVSYVFIIWMIYVSTL
jgi:hypothetical protein